MKRPLSVLLIIAFLGLVGGTFWFLWTKSRAKPVVYDTESPQVMDLVKKTVATGAIVPRQEDEIKPRISGILEAIKVEPGQRVKQGDQIAKVQIIPNAENQARTAAQSQLEIARNGENRGGGKQSNVIVISPVDGMVIDVPVKVGFSVIEANNFNAGTTIAIVADMGDMIFDGQLDESEVGKVKEGMTLKIKIGALEDPVEGKLEYIAPKGKTVEGAIQFEIKAAIVKKPDVFIRAGYSANADIVLDQRKQALSIREALVQFDAGKPFVEIETTPQTFV